MPHESGTPDRYGDERFTRTAVRGTPDRYVHQGETEPCPDCPDCPPAGETSMSWGPDFGDASDDSTFSVGASIALTDAAVDPGAFTLGAALALTDMSATFGASDIGGIADLTELVYDADDTRGADGASNNGPDPWTNPANAAGLRNGTEASRAGQVAASTDANLFLTYPNYTGGLEAFTITLVELRFDTRQTGTALNNGGLHHEYRLAAVGAWTSLEIFTGNIDNNPKTYDITAAIAGDWANLDALEARVRAVLGVGTNLVTCFCDAVEVHVEANQVVAL